MKVVRTPTLTNMSDPPSPTAAQQNTDTVANTDGSDDIGVAPEEYPHLMHHTLYTSTDNDAKSAAVTTNSTMYEEAHDDNGDIPDLVPYSQQVHQEYSLFSTCRRPNRRIRHQHQQQCAAVIGNITTSAILLRGKWKTCTSDKYLHASIEQRLDRVEDMVHQLDADIAASRTDFTKFEHSMAKTKRLVDEFKTHVDNKLSDDNSKLELASTTRLTWSKNVGEDE